ncbi:MAG: glycosyltransferase family 2 protein [Dysgonomonas sp.]
MNKISVISITFNNAAGLRRTIESVIQQTYTNYEFIIIDGGSSDESVEIIKQHERHITYWVSESDRGIYNAMNKGLAVASGDYVHFLNAGDVYAAPNVLEQFFKELQQAAFIRGTQICNYGDRTEIWTNLGEEKVTLYSMYENTILHQATFIRRNLFDKYGLYDENLKITSDWKFFFQAILGGEDSLFLNIPVVDFEMFGISTSPEYGTLHKQERAAVIKELMPANLLPDYERLFASKKDAYIVRFVKSNKFFFWMFKVIRKICLNIGIGEK